MFLVGLMETNFKRRGVVLTITGAIWCFFMVFPTTGVSEVHKTSSVGPSQFPHESINAFINSGEKGLLTAFKGDSNFGASRLQLSYFMKEGSNFSGEFMVGNYTDEEMTYFVYCLIDYKLQEFRFSGTKGIVHSISLKSKSRKIFPVVVDSIGKGAHDFILLGLRKPHVLNMKNKITDHPIIYHRANLFVDSFEFPGQIPDSYPFIGTEIKFPEIVINRFPEPDNFRISEGSPFFENLYLHINNYHTGHVRYTALILKGKISNTPSSEIEIQAAQLSVGPLSAVSVPLSLLINRPADYLTGIIFENPYVTLEIEPGKMNQEPNGIYLSNTVKGGSQ